MRMKHPIYIYMAPNLPIARVHVKLRRAILMDLFIGEKKRRLDFFDVSQVTVMGIVQWRIH